MRESRAVVIGAGIGGLAAAIILAARGEAVTVLEKLATPGGKMREIVIDGQAIDSGPTVLTLPWVFERLAAAGGKTLADLVALKPLPVLARHAWDERTRFDLHAERERARDAVGAFAGASEATRYLEFCDDAKTIYITLRDSFLLAPATSPFGLACRVGLSRPSRLFGINPFETLWAALGRYFYDARLRQLFARYATYTGASPFACPATLMLIAHVEQEGVHAVVGGMQRLAEGLHRLAEDLGVRFRFNAPVDEILARDRRVTGVRLATEEIVDADAVLCNADANAIADGRFGSAVAGAVAPLDRERRSLSAVTFSMLAEARGFPLHYHTVFFSPDYHAEFADLAKGRPPSNPTVYVCAQDRLEEGGAAGLERLFCLVNAPPLGDRAPRVRQEISECEEAMHGRLRACGLNLRNAPTTQVTTTPEDFARAFPATGGALYGRVNHGWRAVFQRPGAQSRIAGLYLAGGSVHPGPGVPMVALSGILAAERLIADRHSTRRFRAAGIAGGMSTRSATTAGTPSR